jgi:hypothetical protein
VRTAKARRALVALCACTLLAAPLAPALSARAEGAPSNECETEKLLYELAAYAIGKEAKPESATEVAAGSPVRFEAESEWPISFDVASSEEALSHPDIDHGSGSPQKGQRENATDYVFVSTRAAAKEGTVYWVVSFTRTLPHCGGEERTFYSNSLHEKAHTLIVLAPAVAPEPPPPAETPPSAPNPTSGHTTSWSGGSSTTASAKIGITAAKLIHLHRQALAYLISCTVECAGSTSARGWLLRGHRKPIPLKILRCGPRRFKVAGSTGGHLHITCRFRGPALRRLHALLAHHKRVRLQISASAKAAGDARLHVARSILLTH